MRPKLSGAALAGAAALATLAAPAGAEAQASPRACTEGPVLTYLANEAVFVEGADGSILIDAPFTDGVDPYPRIEPGTLRQIRDAEPPFDAVDWILITHEHADHGDADAIADHLLANPRTRLASTAAVVEAVRTSIAERQRSPEVPADVARRLVVVEPAEGQPEGVQAKADAPRIEGVALHHGRDQGAAANLGWLVDLGGTRLLHMGDSEIVASDLAARRLAGLDIDIALAPTWYLSSGTYRPVLEMLEAERILLIHFGRDGASEALSGRAATHDPPIEFLTAPGAKMCLVSEGEVSSR